jgi:hypothetical protein
MNLCGHIFVREDAILFAWMPFYLRGHHLIRTNASSYERIPTGLDGLFSSMPTPMCLLDPLTWIVSSPRQH